MPIQFEQENPIIVDQPIASHAQGLEAIAQTLGSVSHEVIKAAGDIAEQQSNAMYATSQAHLDTLKTNTKIQMIQHPGEAAKIAESAANDYSQVLNEAVVNKSDRSKLKLSAERDFNDIRVDAARTQFGVDRLRAYTAFSENFPAMMANLKESVGDEKEFNNRLNSAKDLISSLVVSQALTPRQADVYYKMLNHSVDAANQYMTAVNERNMTAQDYHRIKGGLIPVDDGTHMNQPVDQSTAHLYQAHLNDSTMQTLKADIANGNAGNPAAWFELGDKEGMHLTAYAHGASMVDAELKAGQPFPAIVAKMNTMQKKGTLSSDEEGYVARAKHLVGDGGIDQFNQVLASNPLYREAEFNYNQQVAAVHGNPNLSPEQQQNLIKNYDNDLAWKKVALSESMHIPDGKINPLSPSFVAPTKAVWGLGADPSALITHVDYMQGNLKEYLARSQTTTLQQETTRIVGGISGGKKMIYGDRTLAERIFGHEERITDADRRDLVLANQTNRSFSDLKSNDRGVSDKKISVKVALHMPDAVSFLPTQKDGAVRQNAAIAAATNLAKYYAQLSGDTEMKHMDDHIRRATAIVNAAYPIAKGTNWRVNTNDVTVGGVDNWHMDVKANYLINRAKADLLTAYGNNRAALDADLSSNNLSVISTPTGYLAVIDSYGSEIYRTKDRGSLLHYAVHTMKEDEEGASRVASIPERKVTAETLDDDLAETEKMRKKGDKQRDNLKKKLDKTRQETTH